MSLFGPALAFILLSSAAPSPTVPSGSYKQRLEVLRAEAKQAVGKRDFAAATRAYIEMHKVARDDQGAGHDNSVNFLTKAVGTALKAPEIHSLCELQALLSAAASASSDRKAELLADPQKKVTAALAEQRHTCSRAAPDVPDVGAPGPTPVPAPVPTPTSATAPEPEPDPLLPLEPGRSQPRPAETSAVTAPNRADAIIPRAATPAAPIPAEGPAQPPAVGVEPRRGLKAGGYFSLGVIGGGGLALLIGGLVWGKDAAQKGETMASSAVHVDDLQSVIDEGTTANNLVLAGVIVATTGIVVGAALLGAAHRSKRAKRVSKALSLGVRF